MTTNARLLQGSLRDFGLVEILQMMELGGMTGALRLKQFSGRTGIIYFSDGKLASCSELDAGALALGDVLQQLGMATSPQIEQAFDDVMAVRRRRWGPALRPGARSAITAETPSA